MAVIITIFIGSSEKIDMKYTQKFKIIFKQAILFIIISTDYIIFIVIKL